MIRSIQFTINREVVDFRDREQDMVVLTVYIDNKKFDAATVYDEDSAYALMRWYQIFSQLDVDIYNYDVYTKFFSIEDRESEFRNWNTDGEKAAFENNF